MQLSNINAPAVGAILLWSCQPTDRALAGWGQSKRRDPDCIKSAIAAALRGDTDGDPIYVFQSPVFMALYEGDTYA